MYQESYQIKKDAEKAGNVPKETARELLYTDEERDKYIEESLNKPLPGGEDKGPTLVKKRILQKNNGGK